MFSYLLLISLFSITITLPLYWTQTNISNCENCNLFCYRPTLYKLPFLCANSDIYLNQGFIPTPTSTTFIICLGVGAFAFGALLSYLIPKLLNFITSSKESDSFELIEQKYLETVANEEEGKLVRDNEIDNKYKLIVNEDYKVDGFIADNN